MTKLTTANCFLITAAMFPLALTACAVEPNSDYRSTYSDADVPVTVYRESTTVTPATTYYDTENHETVQDGPTIHTTETVGPASTTYEDSEGFWHTTYDLDQ